MGSLSMFDHLQLVCWQGAMTRTVGSEIQLSEVETNEKKHTHRGE